MNKFPTYTSYIVLILFLSACSNLSTDKNLPNLGALTKLQEISGKIPKAVKILSGTRTLDEASDEVRKVRPLESLAGTDGITVNLGEGFKKALRQAVVSDPYIRSLEQDLAARRLEIKALETDKDLKVSGSIYGGVEDVSDKTSGVAMVVSANRMLYDGGSLDATIQSLKYSVASKEKELMAEKNKKALLLTSIWIDLERFQRLEQLMQARLSVLDPLIVQLEKVAEAGIGDVSKVAAAQRTVSQIRMTQENVDESLSQTELGFQNAFGSLPQGISLDTEYISKMTPEKVSDEMIRNSPGILGYYYAYQGLESELTAIKSKNSFVLGFEARSTRPFGSSEYESEDSVGLVLNKTLLNGDKYDVEAQQVEARIGGAISKIENAFKEVSEIISAKTQTINSMEKAISLSKRNAELTADEIVYLRKQLVIGGSTLDNVLSAEARLYQAEANEINFFADKLKAELTISAALGILSDSVGF